MTPFFTLPKWLYSSIIKSPIALGLKLVHPIYKFLSSGKLLINILREYDVYLGTGHLFFQMRYPVINS